MQKGKVVGFAALESAPKMPPKGDASMGKPLVLFGAGASYGSDQHSTPPLGETLFDDLRLYNPDGWGAVPAELSDVFSRDFEVGMEKLAAERSHAMPVLQRAMAAYFFRYVPSSTSLYVRLAERMAASRWSGACATLNYERLLEIAIAHAGLRPVVGAASDGGTQIELCLPHGCCHIFCESVRGSASGVSFSGIGVTTDGPVICVADPARHLERIRQDAFPPVMSYFEPQKRTTSGRSFIEGQRTRWSELAAHASTIAIVGVRVRTRDEHIWGPLEESPARLVYCAGHSAGVEFERWHDSARAGSPSTVLRGYFAEELDHLCHELDLA